MNRKEQSIVELISPTVTDVGCRVWGVELLAQGRHSKLRIYIDKDDGITIDDCTQVSRRVSDLLDVEDPFGDAYTLEVSSPGLDRILFTPEQYLANIGQQLEIRLNFPFEGRRRVTGVLTAFEHDEVIVQVEDEEFLLPIENVQRARIVPQFD